MKQISTFLMLFFGLQSISFGQEYHIKGCVTDSSGAAIWAATVMVLQGEVIVNGAVTDENGFYSIFPIDASEENMFVAVEYLSAKE